MGHAIGDWNADGLMDWFWGGGGGGGGGGLGRRCSQGACVAP